MPLKTRSRSSRSSTAQAGTVGTRFADRTDIGVSLRKTIAKTYHGLAAWPKAEAQWRAVLEAEPKPIVNRRPAF